MTRNILRLAPLAAALLLAACNGVSTVHVETNGPATVAVDGQNLGQAPVTFPISWRNHSLDDIYYGSRRVTVTADGKVVYDKDISTDISDMASRGDYVNGSQYGYGRTYTLHVDVHATPRP